MSEFVERVAKAVHAAHQNAPYPWWHSEADKCRVAPHIARAAIAEVLDWLAEPSEAVLDAGAGKLFGGRYDDWSEDALEVLTAMLARARKEALGK